MMLEEKDEDINLDQLNDENNRNPGDNFKLVKPGQINNFTNILKKLVKYDRDLFDIFSKVKINNNPDNMQQGLDIFNSNPDNMQQGLGFFNSLLNVENDSDSKGKEHDPSNALEIAEKNTSTVEEKIDYIMGNYEKNSVLADMQMAAYTTGYSFSLIFALVSEIAKGENNFECELETAFVFESMETKGQLTPEQKKKLNEIHSNLVVSVGNLFAFESEQPEIPSFVNQSNKEEFLSQLRERVQNYKAAKEDLEKLCDGTLAQVKEVLGIPNENNKDNLNLNLDIKKDKDEQFAIKRTFWGYMGSFLKNILLDLTLINPIRKIFFLNKIKGQIPSLKTKIDDQFKQFKQFKQLIEKLNQSKQKNLLEKIGTQSTQIIEKMLNNILERISKKNNPWLLILDVVVCTSLILFVCSLIFAWGSILNYIFLATLLASIVYKGIKQYRQECRKYLATKASQYLNKPPQNSIYDTIYDTFDQMQRETNTRKQFVISRINSEIKVYESMIKQVVENNIDNEEKPEEEEKEEEKEDIK